MVLCSSLSNDNEMAALIAVSITSSLMQVLDRWHHCDTIRIWVICDIKVIKMGHKGHRQYDIVFNPSAGNDMSLTMS